VEIIRNINYKFSVSTSKLKIPNLKLVMIASVLTALYLASCSKKPAELYNDGMKLFVAEKYADAQTDFGKGIKKEDQHDLFSRNDSLYAGFIAANLVTGKYPQINQTYNDFTNGIHDSLVRMFGKRAMKALGITTEVIPYKIEGGNRVPADFPQTIVLQAVADHQGFFTIKQQIDKTIKQ